jgi:NAD(P)-dependent dehydrogenase (short-subunit alcohol dehydrogenase family)
MNKQKKNAVVVGATGTLGRAVSQALADSGFTLDPVWQTADHPDATQPDAYKDLPKEIHCAVYIPGINIVKSTIDFTLEEWNRVIAVNLTGAFLFAQAAYPNMVRADGATFIVISSILATHPYPRRLPYSVSKAGLEGMTRSLAVEWGKDGISTHCIRLGHLETIMKSSSMDPKLLDIVRAHTPSGILVDPSAVADYIAWLASGGSQFVSGGIIDFDPAYIINRSPEV